MSGYPNAGDWTGHTCPDTRILEIGQDNVRTCECWRLGRTYMLGSPNAGDWTGHTSGCPNAGDWTGHTCPDIGMLETGPDTVRISEC